LLPATWGRIDFPALSVLDRRTAIDSVLVKDHQAHAQARHRRHYGCCALQHPEAQARRRMLTLRLRDATTRPQCSLFVLWQGDANAQYKLAVFYDNSLGVPQDKVSAYMWLDLSAAQGREGTAAFRDLVARRMSPAQKEEAQKLAHEWKSLSR
jgi:TPR repeat protein